MFGAILSGIGGIFGASSANKAAKAQQQAAADQLALAREIDSRTTGYFEPYRGFGQNALSAYAYEMGLAPLPNIASGGMSIKEQTTTRPGSTQVITVGGGRGEGSQRVTTPSVTSTRYMVGDTPFTSRADAQAYIDGQGTPYEGYKATPGYQFRMNQGMDALEGSAAARGGLFSGNTAKAITEYGQNFATAEYGNHMNRLRDAVGIGQGAAANQASSGANLLSAGTQAYGNIGNAQAAGAIGVSNALNAGFGNALGAWNYQNTLGGGNVRPLGQSGNPFGGFVNALS